MAKSPKKQSVGEYFNKMYTLYFDELANLLILVASCSIYSSLDLVKQIGVFIVQPMCS